MIESKGMNHIHIPSLFVRPSIYQRKSEKMITNREYIRTRIRDAYPHLMYNNDSKLSKLNVNELRIMFASINGDMKNASKKELLDDFAQHKRHCDKVHAQFGF